MQSALHCALQAGYRHIDTAALYMNEAAIGQVLAEWIQSEKVRREELFIVTKVMEPIPVLAPCPDEGVDLLRSCRRLETDRKKWSAS